MTKNLKTRRLVIGTVVFLLAATPGWADDKTADQMVHDLSPAPKQLQSHGWSPTMSLEIVGPGQAPVPVYTPPPEAPAPRTSIAVFFDFASATIKPESMPELRKLATAMNQAGLARFRFAIIGHTDAKGSTAQNLRLSVLRGAAVFAALTTQFGVAPSRLFVQGLGKDSAGGSDPNAAENRRVEIVNMF